MKFRFAVDNSSGNFTGDLSMVVYHTKIDKNETSGGYKKVPDEIDLTYFGKVNNLISLKVSILHQNYYNMLG